MSTVISQDSAIVLTPYSVSASYTKLQSDMSAFQPIALTTVSGFLLIQKDSNQLQNDLQTAIGTLSGSQLSITDSLTLLLSRLAFEPVLIGYLVTMIALKPTFDNVLGIFSVRKTILAILQEQDSLTQTMDQGLQKIMNPFIGYGMQGLAVAEHALFVATEAVYSIPAPAGKIELPAGQVPDPTVPGAVTSVV